MDIVNEGTRYGVNIAFADENGTAATPGTVSYKVTDQGGATVIGATSVVASNGAAQVVIESHDNACLVPGSKTELRRIVITANDLAVTEHCYLLRRVI